MSSHFESFEHVTLLVNEIRSFSILSLIYRPPCSSLSSFVSDFDDFLARLCLFDKYVILGNFNIHVNDLSNSYVTHFSELLQQYGFHQYVRDPTHSAGHIIDLIEAHAHDSFIESVLVHDYCMSQKVIIR